MKITLPSANKCIYCGAVDTFLTNEHIVPFGLGSDRVFPKASCEECRKATHKVEEHCLRAMAGTARIQMGLPTRRPKERPTHAIVDSARIPFKELPITVSLPVYEPARLMRANTNSVEVKSFQWTWSTEADEESRSKLNDEYGVNGIKSREITGEDALIFARFLAKMAHGFISAVCGIDTFEPFLPPLIRGKDENYTDFIGSPSGYDFAREDRLISIDSMLNEKSLLVAASIRMFASLGGPKYHVIVGKLKSRESFPFLANPA